MTKHETLFHEIAKQIPNVKEAKMFGAIGLKAPNNKSGVMFWKESMVFKLSGDNEAHALKLKGAKPFEPMPGRKMGGWIEIPNTHSSKWKEFAEVAMDGVRKLKGK